jgi:myo-inositol-1(or 4)-monophosphatase
MLKKAGKELMKHYGKIEAIRHKSEMEKDSVTELDISTENFLAQNLHKAYPEIGFVGEETDGDRSAECFWLCDPIDGTTHFIRGMPFCTTMLALIEGGQPVFSAIYDFIGDNLYAAEKGKGATQNGKHIRVSNRGLAQSYVGWETHLDADKPGNMKMFMRLKEKSILFKTVSSGFEFAMVACGKLDARICFDPYGKDYDYAPGAFLVSEAGGIVRNIGKNNYDYRNLDFTAANPTVYEELTQGPSPLTSPAG